MSSKLRALLRLKMLDTNLTLGEVLSYALAAGVIIWLVGFNLGLIHYLR